MAVELQLPQKPAPMNASLPKGLETQRADLPLADMDQGQFQPAATTHPDPCAACPSPDHPAKILVMDDEEMIRAIVAAMLTGYGVSVAAVPGGREAIAMYRQAMLDGVPFNAVILDLNIPGGLGGKEAIRELLAIDPHVRAIVSSGYADSPVVTHYAAYGFKGVVTKPYTQDELWGVVTQVLA